MIAYLYGKRAKFRELIVTSTIIILAMIAAFLGFRLYSALGKHGAADQEPVLPRADDRPRNPAPVLAPTTDAPRPTVATAPETMVYDPSAEIGIRALFAADKAFDVGKFLGGAQAAYRMILEAFWKGDRDTLRSLCDDDSYDAFVGAIDTREAAGEVLENRLVTINKAIIAAASVNGGTARISVRFEADIAAVTRDAEGRIVAGSMTDAVETHDTWSFVRALSAKTPDWLLDETAAD
jgi:predicted lipid-binding transport protein (Tim44 family)